MYPLAKHINAAVPYINISKYDKELVAILKKAIMPNNIKNKTPSK